jgi:flagellar biosynthesis protein FlhG
MKNNVPLVLSVTSGKGGVGKTNLSVNLAYQLALSGHRVVLLDADLGLANIDILLGIVPEKESLPPAAPERHAR